MGLREIERLSPRAKESKLHWASRGGLCDGGNTNQPHSQVAAASWELGEPEGAWDPGEQGWRGPARLQEDWLVRFCSVSGYCVL